jgi:hypothetical protein
MPKHVRVYYNGFDPDLDKLIEKALEDAGLELFASGCELGGDAERELCFEYTPEKRYVPVLRLAQHELETMGGKGLDLEEVAEKVGGTLIELGYWDVLKITIEGMQMRRRWRKNG